MKLLRIGSASSCDIVLNSDYVSAHHADILLLDDGTITIEDKGSTNGTFVGHNKKRLNPGNEVPVQRGELIVLGDMELQWNRVPMLQKNDKYKAVYNIGTNFRNDIVLNSNVASRFHAVMHVDDKGRAFITDNKSTNGTQINGVKIKPNTPCRIKRGDNVVCGDSDISEQIKGFIPNRLAWIKWVAGIAATAALLVGGYLVFSNISKGGIGGPKPTEMIPSVTYVFAAYHFEIDLEDNPVSQPFGLRYPNEGSLILQATAFFIDRQGRMATNRHVALPWNEEYRTDSIHNELKTAVKNYLNDMIPKEVKNQNDLDRLGLTDFGQKLTKEANYSLSRLNAMLSRVHQSKTVITGKMDYIAVGYPGKFFSDVDELGRCNVICESGSKDKDVAILQLNNKKTPDEIKYIFDIDKFDLNSLVPMDKDLYTIGYPSGLQRAMDLENKTLNPSLTTSKCSKQPSRYIFELQHDATGGSSGSPVFYDGRLVGIISGGYGGNGASTVAVQARYLKELYDNEELDKRP